MRIVQIGREGCGVEVIQFVLRRLDAEREKALAGPVGRIEIEEADELEQAEPDSDGRRNREEADDEDDD